MLELTEHLQVHGEPLLTLRKRGRRHVQAIHGPRTAIDVKKDKLMLTRNNDYIMVGSEFPRLTGKTAGARLKEIKKLLMAL